MTTPTAFDALVADIARLNDLSSDLAAEYRALLGDTPETGDDGRTIVRNKEGTVIARIRISTKE